MIKFVKNLFNKEPQIQEVKEQNVFGIVIGSKIQFNTLIPRAYKTQLPPVVGAKSVEAIGKLELYGCLITRIYLSDKYWLHIITDKDDLNDIQECRLFYETEVFHPSTESSWEEWVNGPQYKIGHITYEHNGLMFYRLESWADPLPNRVQPVTMVEDCVDKSKEGGYIKEHECMAYGRWANEEQQVAEFLLLSAFESASKETKELLDVGVSISVGIDISENEIEVLY